MHKATRGGTGGKAVVVGHGNGNGIVLAGPLGVASLRPRLVQDIWKEMLQIRGRLARYLVCPISREPIDESNGVLASDGYLYDIDSLRQWFGVCVSSGRVLTSPVTREVVRSVVHPAVSIPSVRKAVMVAELDVEQDEDQEGGMDSSHGGSSSSMLLIDLLVGCTRQSPAGGSQHHHHHHHHDPHLPPSKAFSAHPMVGGTIPASRLNTSFGVALQMVLGWDSEGTVVWTAPVEEDEHENCRLLLPAPIAELVPLTKPILSALGIPYKRFQNPECILTAYFRFENSASLDHAPDSSTSSSRQFAAGAAGVLSSSSSESSSRSPSSSGPRVWATLEQWLLCRRDPFS